MGEPVGAAPMEEEKSGDNVIAGAVPSKPELDNKHSYAVQMDDVPASGDGGAAGPELPEIEVEAPKYEPLKEVNAEILILMGKIEKLQSILFLNGIYGDDDEPTRPKSNDLMDLDDYLENLEKYYENLQLERTVVRNDKGDAWEFLEPKKEITNLEPEKGVAWEITNLEPEKGVAWEITNLDA